MKKHILLFILMSSVLTTTAHAITHPINRSGDCLLGKIGKNDINLNDTKSAYFPPKMATNSITNNIKTRK